jgi:type IV pilus assembly protein PilA
MKKNQKGFSLIELLIVVAIILIIAAIAIPNLLRARMAANESSAVGTLRSINTANATYETLYNYSFANSLPTCTAANLIDNVLSATNTPSKSGYNFNYVGANPNVADTLCNSDTTYTITAVPVTVGGTGNRSFFTDQSGIIRQNPNGVVPTVADLPLN